MITGNGDRWGIRLLLIEKDTAGCEATRPILVHHLFLTSELDYKALGKSDKRDGELPTEATLPGPSPEAAPGFVGVTPPFEVRRE
jgi:hypothetical protein